MMWSLRVANRLIATQSRVNLARLSLHSRLREGTPEIFLQSVDQFAIAGQVMSLLDRCPMDSMDDPFECEYDPLVNEVLK